MIKWASQYFGSISPAFLDGAIYVCIAFFGALTAAFGTDEAKQFLSAAVLFWLKMACASISAALLALKMFRSTAYADHLAEKETKQQEQKP